MQAGPVGPAEMHMHVRLNHTLSTVFNNVQTYVSYVPTYASPWSFTLGSDSPIEARPQPEEIDRILQEKTTGGFRMFDGTTHLGMCQLPAHLRRAIAAETHIYTLSKPPKFFGKGSAGQAETI